MFVKVGAFKIFVYYQAQKGLLNKSSEPFGIRAKTFWDVKETRMVRMCVCVCMTADLDCSVAMYCYFYFQILESFLQNLSHKNDGLIFSPAKDVCVSVSVGVCVCMCVCVCVCPYVQCTLMSVTNEFLK